MTEVSRALRREARQRANDRCEYCRKPNVATYFGYHVDHIRPLQHHGTSALDNLAWACGECNINKGRDLTSFDVVTNKITALYNPRTQNWDDHFTLDQAVIVAKTDIGRVTIHLLQMNHEEQIKARKWIMDAGLW